MNGLLGRAAAVDAGAAGRAGATGAVGAAGAAEVLAAAARVNQSVLTITVQTYRVLSPKRRREAMAADGGLAGWWL